MPHINSTPFKHHLHNPTTLLSLLRLDSTTKKPPKSKPKPPSKPNNFLKLFKLFPLLTSGCKVAAMLASKHPRRAMIADHATIGTLLGHRRGRMSLAIQEDPHSPPFFVVELPLLSTAFHREMGGDTVRVALETETKTRKRRLTEEFVWGVYCNGRKVGYCIRRTQLSDDEVRVLHALRGVSMGAGVLPDHDHHDHDQYHDDHDEGMKREKGERDHITYLRARFERVVGSKDSEALYMINPDPTDGPELSIFFLRVI